MVRKFEGGKLIVNETLTVETPFRTIARASERRRGATPVTRRPDTKLLN